VGYEGDTGSAASSTTLLNHPGGIALDAVGNIYFADTLNCVVRKITISTGIITTIAGAPATADTATTAGTSYCGYVTGEDGGLATSAALNSPTGIAVDSAGNIFVNDESNQRTRVFVQLKSTPTITWATPAAINYGTALSTTQLNASFSVPGTCVYSPAVGTVLTPGTQTLSVTCTPTDTANINTVTATVSLTVSAITQSTSGNIGVGTTSPIATLQVGNGSTTTPQALYIDSNLNGNTVSAPSPGVWIEWNGISGAGDPAAGMTDFINNEGSGSGGWQFINTNASGTPINPPAMVIQGTSGNVGIGTTAPGAKLEVSGSVKLTTGSGGSITFQDGSTQSTAYTGVTCGGDYAESVDVSGDRKTFTPGDVLVIDPSAPGKFLKSNEAYSTLVTGIYSTKPGTVGRRLTTPKSPDEVPMALVGIVPVKVSAENGPIKPGDLLVASSTTGYAMKGTDRGRMLGAVIGKALGALDSGKGVIEAVVTLQ
jgi:hypothetical protein